MQIFYKTVFQYNFRTMKYKYILIRKIMTKIKRKITFYVFKLKIPIR